MADRTLLKAQIMFRLQRDVFFTGLPTHPGPHASTEPKASEREAETVNDFMASVSHWRMFHLLLQSRAETNTKRTV